MSSAIGPKSQTGGRRRMVLVASVWIGVTSCCSLSCTSAVTITFERHPIPVGSPYSVKACIDAVCSSTSGEVTSAEAPLEVTVPFGTEIDEPVEYLAVDLRDQSLAMVAEYTGEVQFNSTGACGEECWHGVVNAP